MGSKGVNEKIVPQRFMKPYLPAKFKYISATVIEFRFFNMTKKNIAKKMKNMDNL